MNKEDNDGIEERYGEASILYPNYDQYLERIAFEEGALWQEKQMFTKEDMIKAFDAGRNCEFDNNKHYEEQKVQFIKNFKK